jgi:hypothetical protein
MDLEGREGKILRQAASEGKGKNASLCWASVERGKKYGEIQTPSKTNFKFQVLEFCIEC